MVDRPPHSDDEKQPGLLARLEAWFHHERLLLDSTLSMHPYVGAYTHSPEAWASIREQERRAKEELAVLEGTATF